MALNLEDIAMDIARTVYTPADCPVSVLPFLAWAYSVDTWDDSWDEGQKRAVIDAAYIVHRHKGTIGAVKAALEALGIGARIVEWFETEPKGPPFTFRISFDLQDSGVSQAQLKRAIEVVDASKNLRSHIETVDIGLSTNSEQFVGVVVGTGYNITIQAG